MTRADSWVIISGMGRDFRSKCSQITYEVSAKGIIRGPRSRLSTMRNLSSGVSLAILLLAASAAPASAADLPGRTELWASSAAYAAPAGADARELSRWAALQDCIASDTGVMWARDAVPDPPEARFLSSADEMIRFVEFFRVMKPAQAKVRRLGAACAFGLVAGSVRDRVLAHPGEKVLASRWRRIEDLRRALAGDRDQRLRAYMERFASERPRPDWRSRRQEAQRLDATFRALPPNGAELAEQVWTTATSLERNMGLLRKRLGSGAALPPALAAAADTAYEHRLSVLWGNSYPRIIAEAVGKDEAARLGVKIRTVRLGWADLFAE